MDPIYSALFEDLYHLTKDIRFMPIRKLQKKKVRTKDTQNEEEQEEDASEEFFIEDFAPMLYSLALIGLISLIYCVLGVLGQCSKNCRARKQRMWRFFFWNGILITLLEGYLGFIISALKRLQKGYRFDTLLQSFNSVYSFCYLGILFLAPIKMTRYFRRHIDKFKDPEFREKFGEVIEGLTHRREGAGNTFALFCYRRLLLVVLMVFMAEQNYF